MSAAVRYYHHDYRKDEVTGIVSALDRGQSVSVIGPPSVGKTNLLRFLDQERLAVNDSLSPWNRYAPLSRQQGPLIAINIDPNALLPALPTGQGDVAARAWPGFELLVHRTSITSQLYPVYRRAADRDPDTDLAAKITRLQSHFDNAHPDVTDFEDHLHAQLALRHLESIIDATLTGHRLQGTPIRIVYFMDEFERLLETMPNYFFVALRSIRDRFKYNVMFATFTRNSLPYLVGSQRLAAIEPFLELFNDCTLYLRPFNDEDAWRMIEQLEERTVPKDDYAMGLLMRATGGFAGLLRAGFLHADKIAPIKHEDYGTAVAQASTRLLQETNIQAECETLLRGLNSTEIAAMYNTVLGSYENIDAATARELLHKSLMAQDARGGALRVSPPILGAYIRTHPTPPEPIPPVPPVTLPEA
jgi:hypothetical protein